MSDLRLERAESVDLAVRNVGRFKGTTKLCVGGEDRVILNYEGDAWMDKATTPDEALQMLSALVGGWSMMMEALKREPTYLEQENAVLHARVRQLEISLSSEREACAKVAEEYGAKLAGDDDAFTKWQSESAVSAANSIASLIRGRGEK